MANLDHRKPVCVVMGAGIGIGASLARAFAAEGLQVCLVRRERNLVQVEELAGDIHRSGQDAHAYGVDARDPEAVAALFKRIEADIGPIEVTVFNIGANVRFGIEETTPRVYRKVWEMAAFAGFLSGQQAAKAMVPRGRGAILFTGATASLRGAAGFSAFAGAKHALRALAQSMARELGPKGIHVAHIIIDGMVDGKFARENFADVDGLLEQAKILAPDDIAQTYVNIWKQPKGAWTHELDLRPWTETF